MTQTQSPADSTLIYGIEDRPPLHDAFFAALQHLLAIFVAIITPPLIIAQALGLDKETTGFMVSMSLLASGICTFIQCRRIGPVGCRMLCVQGTSFSFIGPIIAIGTVSGLPAVFGACVLGAPVEILVSCTFRYLRKVITPLVSGTVVMLIGLTLIKVGITSCGGGDINAPEFGSLRNVGVAVVVLISVMVFNLSRFKYLRMSSIFLGIVFGYAVSASLGMVDYSAIAGATDKYFYDIVPFKYGFEVSWSAIFSMGIVYLVTAIEATGDVTANSIISGLSLDDKDYVKRISGGVMADGVNSMIAGLFSSFPNSIFAQNNGIIQLTGVASRYVGYFIAGMLVFWVSSPSWEVCSPPSPLRCSAAPPSDVRHDSRDGRTYRGFTAHRPQGHPRTGRQSLVRHGRGIDARHSARHSRQRAHHLLQRHHHRRTDRHRRQYRGASVGQKEEREK